MASNNLDLYYDSLGVYDDIDTSGIQEDIVSKKINKLSERIKLKKSKIPTVGDFKKDEYYDGESSNLVKNKYVDAPETFHNNDDNGEISKVLKQFAFLNPDLSPDEAYYIGEAQVAAYKEAKANGQDLGKEFYNLRLSGEISDDIAPTVFDIFNAGDQSAEFAKQDEINNNIDGRNQSYKFINGEKDSNGKYLSSNVGYAHRLIGQGFAIPDSRDIDEYKDGLAILNNAKDAGRGVFSTTTGRKIMDAALATSDSYNFFNNPNKVYSTDEMLHYESADNFQEHIGNTIARNQVFRDNESGKFYEQEKDFKGNYVNNEDGSPSYVEVPESEVRAMYFDTSNNSLDGKNIKKVGLARTDLKKEMWEQYGDSAPFIARYMDKRNYNPYTSAYSPKENEVDQVTGTPYQGYNGTPGAFGVDVSNGADAVILMRKDAATGLEKYIHTNAGQVSSRAAGADALITKDSLDKNKLLFGAGTSEYTFDNSPLYNNQFDMANVRSSLTDELLAEPMIVDGNDISESFKLIADGASTVRADEIETAYKTEIKAKHPDGWHTIFNAVKAIPYEFTSSLVSMVDGVGELTGLYDIDMDKVDNKIAKAVGYDSHYSELAQELAALDMQDAWKQYKKDGSISFKSLMHGAYEMFKEPAMWGNSIGFMFSFLAPAKISTTSMKVGMFGPKIANLTSKIYEIEKLTDVTSATKYAMKIAEYNKAGAGAFSGYLAAIELPVILAANKTVQDEKVEFKKNNGGEDMPLSKQIFSFGTALVTTKLDVATDVNLAFAAKHNLKSVINDIAEGSVGKALVGISASSTEFALDTLSEGTVEALQQAQQIDAQEVGSAKFKDQSFMDRMSDDKNAIDTLTGFIGGIGGAPQFKAAGFAKDVSMYAGEKAFPFLKNGVNDIRSKLDNAIDDKAKSDEESFKQRTIFSVNGKSKEELESHISNSDILYGDYFDSDVDYSSLSAEKKAEIANGLSGVVDAAVELDNIYSREEDYNPDESESNTVGLKALDTYDKLVAHLTSELILYERKGKAGLFYKKYDDLLSMKVKRDISSTHNEIVEEDKDLNDQIHAAGTEELDFSFLDENAHEEDSTTGDDLEDVFMDEPENTSENTSDFDILDTNTKEEDISEDDKEKNMQDVFDILNAVGPDNKQKHKENNGTKQNENKKSQTIDENIDSNTGQTDTHTEGFSARTISKIANKLSATAKSIQKTLNSSFNEFSLLKTKYIGTKANDIQNKIYHGENGIVTNLTKLRFALKSGNSKLALAASKSLNKRHYDQENKLNRYAVKYDELSSIVKTLVDGYNKTGDINSFINRLKTIDNNSAEFRPAYATASLKASDVVLDYLDGIKNKDVVLDAIEKNFSNSFDREGYNAFKSSKVKLLMRAIRDSMKHSSQALTSVGVNPRRSTGIKLTIDQQIAGHKMLIHNIENELKDLETNGANDKLSEIDKVNLLQKLDRRNKAIERLKEEKSNAFSSGARFALTSNTEEINNLKLKLKKLEEISDKTDEDIADIEDIKSTIAGMINDEDIVQVLLDNTGKDFGMSPESSLDVKQIHRNHRSKNGILNEIMSEDEYTRSIEKDKYLEDVEESFKRALTDEEKAKAAVEVVKISEEIKEIKEELSESSDDFLHATNEALGTIKKLKQDDSIEMDDKFNDIYDALNSVPGSKVSEDEAANVFGILDEITDEIKSKKTSKKKTDNEADNDVYDDADDPIAKALKIFDKVSSIAKDIVEKSDELSSKASALHKIKGHIVGVAQTQDMLNNGMTPPTGVTTREYKDGKNIISDQPLDIAKYITLEDTALSSMSVSDIANLIQDEDLRNRFLDDVVKVKQTLQDNISLKMNSKKKGEENSKDTLDTEMILYDMPIARLMYDKNGNVNETFAAAVMMSSYEWAGAFGVKNLINSGDQVARMLLRDNENDVAPEEISLLREAGSFRKMTVDGFAHSLFKKLGIKLKDDSISRDFKEKILGSAGSTVLAALSGLNLIVNPNKSRISSAKWNSVYKEIDSTKLLKEKENVPMVQSVEEKKETYIELRDVFKDYSTTLNIDPYYKNYKTEFDKKKPSYYRKVRGENFSVPAASAEVWKTLEEEEYSVSYAALHDMIEIFKGDSKSLKETRMNFLISAGWKDTDQMELDNKNSSGPAIHKHETIESQKGVNRELENSFDELYDLISKLKTKDIANNSLFFDWFFTKGGRFTLDSIGINPQSEKLLHRWLVLPSSIQNREWNMLDSDDKYYFSETIAQGLGFDIDKSSPDKIIESVSPLLEAKGKERDAVLSSIEEAIRKGSKKDIVIGEKTFTINPEHPGHTILEYRALKDYYDAVDYGSDSFNTTSVAEYDSTTSGFHNKLMQAPLLGEYNEEWLNKTGGFSEGNHPVDKDGKDIEMSEYIESGENDDAYRSLVRLVNESKDTLSSVIKDDGTVDKQATNALNSMKINVKDDNDKTVFSAVPELLVDNVVTSAARNMFKYPFMIFNYSASIKTIRKNLSSSLADNIVDGILSGHYDSEEYTYNKNVEFLRYIGLSEKNNLDRFKSELKTKNAREIYIVKKDRNGKSFRLYPFRKITFLIDKTYGVAVEDAMNSKFQPIVQFNNMIISMTKIMFMAFESELKRNVRLIENSNNRSISVGEYNDLIKKLNKEFPLIKAPLSATRTEGISIIKSKLANQEDSYVEKPNTMIRDGEEFIKHTIVGMKRELAEAHASGSTLPMHWIDGTIIGMLLKKGGILGIHDAAVIGKDFTESIKKLNESSYRVATGYNLFGSVVEAFVESIQSVEKKRQAAYDEVNNSDLSELDKRNSIVKINSEFQFDTDDIFVLNESSVVNISGINDETADTMSSNLKEFMQKIVSYSKYIDESREFMFGKHGEKKVKVMNFAGGKNTSFVPSDIRDVSIDDMSIDTVDNYVLRDLVGIANETNNKNSNKLGLYIKNIKEELLGIILEIIDNEEC